MAKLVTVLPKEVKEMAELLQKLGTLMEENVGDPNAEMELRGISEEGRIISVTLSPAISSKCEDCDCGEEYETETPALEDFMTYLQEILETSKKNPKTSSLATTFEEMVRDSIKEFKAKHKPE